MLRLRKNKWGNYLFDAWVVAFTALTIWAIHDARQAGDHANKATKRLAHIAAQNRTLITQNKNISKSFDHKICVRVNNQSNLIIKSLQRSKRNIPKLVYYQEHPTELKDAINQINDQIIDFSPTKCPDGRGGE